MSSSKLMDATREYEQAGHRYELIAGEINVLMHEFDQEPNPEKKKEWRKKIEAAQERLKEADRQEKAAKRAYDAAYRARHKTDA